MIKSELVKRIAERRPLLFERQVEKVVNVVLNEIASALVRGDRVELRGFGVFSVREHRARAARNPATGAPLHLDQRHLPAFKVGRELHRRLNCTVETMSGRVTYPHSAVED